MRSISFSRWRLGRGRGGKEVSGSCKQTTSSLEAETMRAFCLSIIAASLAPVLGSVDGLQNESSTMVFGSFCSRPEAKTASEQMTRTLVDRRQRKALWKSQTYVAHEQLCENATRMPWTKPTCLLAPNQGKESSTHAHMHRPKSDDVHIIEEPDC